MAVYERLKQERRRRKKVCAALKRFIEMTQTQISMITLLQEDNMNPLLHILQMLSHDDKKRSLPPSTHFYVEKSAFKRQTALDWGQALDQKKKKINSISELALAAV